MSEHRILWDGLAALGYDAYFKQMEGKGVDGAPLPIWEALPRAIREAWIAAAFAVADGYSRAALA